MRNVKIFAIILILMLMASYSMAQGVAINTDGATADVSSMLDVKSTSSGMLVPRMTLAQRNSLTLPAHSLLIYQTDNTPGYYYNSGTPASPVWVRLATGSTVDGSGVATRVAFWTGTTTLGSNANLYWDNANSWLGIGTASPTNAKLQIEGSGTYDGVLRIRNTGASGANVFFVASNTSWTFGTNKLGIGLGDPSSTNIKMTIQENGNVGFGTTSPSAQLHTTGTVRFENYPSGASGAIVRTDASGNVAITNFTGSSSNILLGNNTFGSVSDAGGVVSSCGTANYVPKMASSTEIACSQIFDNGTNVGIGTSSPTAKVEILQNMSDYTTSFTGAHLNLGASNTVDNTGFVGITFDASTTANYGWSSGALRSSGGQSDFVWKHHSNSASGTEWMRITSTGNVGIGTTSPNDKLDVVGNAQVSGYMKVGNPSTPTSVDRPNTEIYRTTFNDYEYFDWVLDATCGSASWAYTTYFDGDVPIQRCLNFNNNGGYSRKYIISPWVWIPTGSTSVYAQGHNWCSLENNYDGVFLEYRIYGGSWTKITSFASGGYPDNASGSNTSCSGTNSQSCWNGNMGNFNWATNAISGVAGYWIQFRLCGFEDVSNNTGDFTLDGFTVSVNMPSHGGSFTSGNLYVQNNVYAGSNVMLGDLAEYFKVSDYCEPGDIISISNKEENSYEVCKTAYSDNVIGVYSTSPTLTLNSPNEGIPIALAGRCLVNVTNKNGKIKIGDYLTSSDIPGFAMKADKSCFVIGRALTETDNDGKILVLVQPGWFNQYNYSSPSSLGTYYISEGQNLVRILDNHIGQDSKIFLTMRNDPQCRYWIDRIEPGVFEIRFSDEVISSIEFDYLIESPSLLNSNLENKEITKCDGYNIDVISNLDEGKPQTEVPGKNRYENYTRIDKQMIEDYSDIQPPGPPPDINGKWVWTAKSGYKETNGQTINSE